MKRFSVWHTPWIYGSDGSSLCLKPIRAFCTFKGLLGDVVGPCGCEMRSWSDTFLCWVVGWTWQWNNMWQNHVYLRPEFTEHSSDSTQVRSEETELARRRINKDLIEMGHDWQPPEPVTGLSLPLEGFSARQINTQLLTQDQNLLWLFHGKWIWSLFMFFSTLAFPNICTQIWL